MIIKKEIKQIEEIQIETMELKNLKQLIDNQKETLHSGTYFYKVVDGEPDNWFIKIFFNYKEIEKDNNDKPRMNILQSQFSLNNKKSEEKDNSKHKGYTEIVPVLFKGGEFVEFNKGINDINKDNLISQLEKKRCFKEEKITELGINYRSANSTEYSDLMNETIKKIMSGELTEYTIEEVFKNRHMIEIFSIYKIPTKEDENKYNIVYELKNQKLVSKEEINHITIQSLEKSTSKFLRIDNLELFKNFFYLEKI